MVNLVPIDFQLGLPLNISGNDGQNKFEVYISKNVSKKAHFRPKIGQDANFAPTLTGLNSAIIHPILTFDHIRMISSKLYINFLDFGLPFTPRPYMGSNWVYAPKTTLKLLVHVLAMAPTHSSKPIFQKFWD